MKRTLVRRGAVMASTLGTLASLVGVAAPVHAQTAPVVVGVAGSDTTEKLMAALAPLFTDATRTVVNIPALPPASGPGSVTTVPADADCVATDWVRDSDQNGLPSAPARGLAPFGSSKGRDYLGAESGGTGPGLYTPPDSIGAPVTGQGAGCVDIARSSGGPRTLATNALEKSTFEYFAYAMDAVSWASTSFKAPATLTKADLQKIYNCDAAGHISNWDQVGGTSGVIQRYLPQVGSGTRGFFLSDILGVSSGSLITNTAVFGTPTASCPQIIEIEENNAKPVSAANLDKGILPYSAGLWAFQEKNKAVSSLDLRNGSRLGGISTPDGTPTLRRSPVFYNAAGRNYELDHPNATGGSGVSGVVRETTIAQNGAVDYPGIRYVYNVVDSAGNRPGYQAALNLVGFTNVAGGAKGILCDAAPDSAGLGVDAYGIILDNFFAPLSRTGNFSGNNVAGSTCRRSVPS